MSMFGSTFVEPSVSSGVNASIFDMFAGKRLPVSIRNNNMGAISITGNISDSWAARQPGFVGTTLRPAAEGGSYAVYATPEYGVAAASSLLQRYGQQGTNTPYEIVSKWSSDKSAWGGYSATIVKYLKAAGFNVGANTVIDLDNPAVRTAVLKGKSAYESGAGMPVYSDDVFSRGVGGVFNSSGGYDTTLIGPDGTVTGGFTMPKGGSPLQIGVFGAGETAGNLPNPTMPAGSGPEQTTVEAGESVAPSIEGGVQGGLIGFGNWALGALTEPLYRILFVLMGLIFLVVGLWIISKSVPESSNG